MKKLLLIIAFGVAGCNPENTTNGNDRYVCGYLLPKCYNILYSHTMNKYILQATDTSWMPHQWYMTNHGYSIIGFHLSETTFYDDTCSLMKDFKTYVDGLPRYTNITDFKPINQK